MKGGYLPQNYLDELPIHRNIKSRNNSESCEKKNAVMVGGSSDRSEENLRLRNLGGDVDDDNMFAPENIPTLPDGSVTTTVEGCIFEDWNSSSFFIFLREGHRHERNQVCGFDMSRLSENTSWVVYSYLPLLLLPEQTSPKDNLHNRW